jgi:hypothetical protein
MNFLSALNDCQKKTLKRIRLPLMVVSAEE